MMAPVGAANAAAIAGTAGDTADQRIETSMRAETERLVGEIKQSVGLLRRHL